jgi:serine/threonine protein kinase
MVTIAGAIHHAHQRGILHRDLKPKNILMDHEGNPYVSDFGLARRLKTHTGMTLTGGLVGTPEYMSPEQAESPSRVREATDIYSLGVILYELLTHRPTDLHFRTYLQTLKEKRALRQLNDYADWLKSQVYEPGGDPGGGETSVGGQEQGVLGGLVQSTMEAT